MAIARFEMPDGRIARFEVPDDTPPEQAQALIEKHFASDQDSAEVPPQNERGWLEKAGDTAAGVADAALVFGSAMAAEPLAGLAGFAQSINPFADSGAGAKTVREVRQTISQKPRTDSGASIVESAGNVLEPLGDALSAAESYFGDTVFEITGSPTLAAAAKTLPTFTLELLGLKGHQARQLAKQAKDLRKFSSKSAPTVDRLKETARATYQEIEELGVKVKADAYASMASKITRETKKMGIDPDVTPSANKAVARVNELIGQEVPLSEIETLRKVADGAASSINKHERAIGVAIIDAMDEFLDNAGAQALTKSPDGVSIGQRYKVARGLWGQARKTEMLEEAIRKAGDQASGLENGIRVQFRQILSNDKKRRFFRDDEISAMRTVVRGTKGANFAKALGRLGFSEGAATNILGGMAGTGGGAYIGSMFGPVGGAVGAVAVPALGQVSRALAQRLTMRNAEFAKQVVASGKDGRKIAKAYFEHTPKAERSAFELSELLGMPDIALDLIEPSDDLVKRATEIAKRRRALMTSAVTGASNEGLLKTNQREFVGR